MVAVAFGEMIIDGGAKNVPPFHPQTKLSAKDGYLDTRTTGIYHMPERR